MTRRLRAAGVAASVADDLVARVPAQQVADALEVLPTKGIARGDGPDIAWFTDPAGNILAVLRVP